MNQSKLTAKEIIERLSKSHISISDFAHESKSWLEEYEVKVNKAGELAKKNKDLKYYWEDPEYKRLSEEAEYHTNKYFKDLVGEWTEVQQYGGEGEGDNWYSVKYFKDHNVYIKVQGFYASYDGTSFNGWSDCKEVRPIEKTITVYE